MGKTSRGTKEQINGRTSGTGLKNDKWDFAGDGFG